MYLSRAGQSLLRPAGVPRHKRKSPAHLATSNHNSTKTHYCPVYTHSHRGRMCSPMPVPAPPAPCSPREPAAALSRTILGYCLDHSLSVSFSLFISFTLFLSLSPSFSLTHSLSPSFSLSLSLTLSVSLSLSPLSLWSPPSLIALLPTPPLMAGGRS